MDLSGIIFVALAVAWAVYLVPKALKHHDEVARSRSVDRFSNTMRVLARREPVNHRDARLVVTPPRGGTAPIVTRKPPAAGAAAPTEPVPQVRTPRPEQVRARREAARVAARRRRRVFTVLLLALVTVAGLAAYGLFGWPWVGIPGGLVVVWLVLCR